MEINKGNFIIKDLLVLREYKSIKILNPKEYLEIIEKKPNVI